MTRRWWWLAASLVMAMALTACGGGDDDSAADDEAGVDDTATDIGDDEGDDASTAGSGDGGDGDTGSDDGGGDSADDGGSGDAGDDGDQPEADEPDDEDAAEITGNPDLDLDDLPDDVADALDEIDDIVSIGDCSSEVIGLAFTAPDGWQCRVLDVALGGMDGFTLFTEGNELNITVGTPSPISACEILQACDSAVPIDLGPQWPGAQQFELAGTVTIWGPHADADAEVVVTKLTALTDDELEFVRMVLDSTVAVG